MIVSIKPEEMKPRKAKSALEDLLMAADEMGLRMEYVGGVGIWEVLPVVKHQKALKRIERSIAPVPGLEGGCDCVYYSDILVKFPDGSFKRPDISLFCREPDEEDEAVTLVPEAVVEIISKGHEAKDLELGPPFYLSQGVKDVVVLDPATGLVTHFRKDGETQYVSPAPITLECGCTCTV